MLLEIYTYKTFGKITCSPDDGGRKILDLGTLLNIKEKNYLVKIVTDYTTCAQGKIKYTRTLFFSFLFVSLQMSFSGCNWRVKKIMYKILTLRHRSWPWAILHTNGHSLSFQYKSLITLIFDWIARSQLIRIFYHCTIHRNHRLRTWDLCVTNNTTLGNLVWCREIIKLLPWREKKGNKERTTKHARTTMPSE